MKHARSFAARLTALVTAVTAGAVLLVTAVHVVLEISRTRTQALRSAGAVARMTAADGAAALDFDDREAAADTLRTLAMMPEFAAADIRADPARTPAAPQGAPFATFRRSPSEDLPELPTLPVTEIDGRWLRLAQPIERDGETLGMLTMLYDFQPARERLAKELAAAVGAGLACIGLAYLAALSVQRALLRPVRELSAAAAALAEREDYSVRAKKVSQDELGSLTEVFNTMVARLGEAQALRRDHRQMLELEVSRRTQEALDAQARLRQSERMASLGTLSAGLGHDIGNLLLPLRAHLLSIKDRTRASDDDPDFAAIARATEYLQNLSTSLRMLAQNPEQGEGRQAPTHLADWWGEMEPILRAALGRGITLQHTLGPDLPPVALSKPLLMQAVFNLVQNAAQALAPEGRAPKRDGLIRVEANAVQDGDRPSVALRVIDNGPGMSEEILRRCVEPFYTTKTRRISSGLGLSLVKGIIDGVGGDLRIESIPGSGSTFTLLLPVADQPQVTDRRRAFITIREPRKRALISQLLTALNCAVETGGAAQGAASADAVWVTDALGAVPYEWAGHVVVMGNPPPEGPAMKANITVLDAATPMSEVRHRLRSLLHGNST
jgi:signal transduction histidine kinase